MKSKTKREIKQAVKADFNNDRLGVLNGQRSKEVERAFKGRNLPAGREKKLDTALRDVRKKMGSNLREHIKMENCLSPQACDVVKLMDDPFNKDWEHAKVPWYPGGQPLKSTVVRAMGVQNFEVAPTGQLNTGTQIYWSPNPAFASSAGVGEISSAPIANGATLQKGTPGCPPFAVANATNAALGSLGPHAGYIRTNVALNQLFVFTPTATDSDIYLPWNTPNELGNADIDAPGKFAYRLVAAGIRIVCTNKEVDLGGLISSCRISESVNTGLSGTSLMNVNSSAHYQRGGNTFEMKYIRSSDDDGWFYPTIVGSAASATMPGIRHFITLSPPDSTTTLTCTAIHIAFYEVKGVAAKEVGTPSFQQPEMAGKLTTAFSHVAQRETGDDKGSSKNEIKDTVELVNAKESPAVGKLAKSAKDKKGFLDNVEDFVSDVLPVAKRVAEVAVGFL